MRNLILLALLIAALGSASILSASIPAAASSDSGQSYGCAKVGGQYVWRYGSKCFPHESAEARVKREQGVVVRH